VRKGVSAKVKCEWCFSQARDQWLRHSLAEKEAEAEWRASRRPTRKRRGSSASVVEIGDDSGEEEQDERPAAKKARSDSAVGGKGTARPRPVQARARPQVVLARRAPATFDPMRDLQQLEDSVVAAFASLRARWEDMAHSNASQAKGKGKAKAP
jgi:hypothetical protein